MSRHNPSFADNIYLGLASLPGYNSGAPGIPFPHLTFYEATPATLDADGVATTQNVTTAGATLNGALVSSAGVAVFDVPRNVTVTSSANDVGKTFTATGTDVYGQAMTETISGANATVAAGKKAFSRVSAVVPSANTTNITVGSGDVLGLPFYLADINHVVRLGWASVIGDDAATVVAGNTTTANATTGDVRGTIDASSASDGSRKLTVVYFVTDTNAASQAGGFGIAQA